MDTRQKILERSEMLFIKYGIRSITMDDISRELAISKKTLYQFFDNKAELIRQIVSDFAEKENQAIGDICRQSDNAIAEMLMIGHHVAQSLVKLPPNTLFDLQKYYPESWNLILDLNRKHIYSVVKQNLAKGIKQGLYRPGLNPEIIARLYVGKALLMTDEELFPPADYDRGELFREFIFYHLHGISSPKGLSMLDNFCSPDILKPL